MRFSIIRRATVSRASFPKLFNHNIQHTKTRIELPVSAFRILVLFCCALLFVCCASSVLQAVRLLRVIRLLSICFCRGNAPHFLCKNVRNAPCSHRKNHRKLCAKPGVLSGPISVQKNTGFHFFRIFVQIPISVSFCG